MFTKIPICNVCREPEGASTHFYGLGAKEDDEPGFVEVKVMETECHICIDCIKEIVEFNNTIGK